MDGRYNSLIQNPERHKYSTAILRANKRYPGRITVDDLLEIVEKSGRICYWCKKSGLAGGGLTFEHLEPENRKDCIVVACLSCNAERRKRKRHSESKDLAKLERCRETTRKWRLANPELNKFRRAAETCNKRYPGTGKLTGEDVLAVVERCSRTCHWCKKRELTGPDLTIEHLASFSLIPTTKAGASDIFPKLAGIFFPAAIENCSPAISKW